EVDVAGRIFTSVRRLPEGDDVQRKVRCLLAVAAQEQLAGDGPAVLHLAHHDHLVDGRDGTHHSGLDTPCGTWPVGTYWRADSALVPESSKKMSAAKASRNGPLGSPPRKMASSRRTPHSRRVRMTRLCAGAERAVTSAVRM